MRYPLLLNPNARSQKGRRALRFVMARATKFAVYATRSESDARELAAGFAESGYPIVMAAGGDGTINAVVQGLAGSDTALAMLPTGTMNVFARELGIPFDNLKRCLEVLDEQYVREVDLFEVNGKPFVQMAGVGFDAQVIAQTSWESKKALGPISYLVAAIKVLGESPPKMRVYLDDGRVLNGACVLVGNGALYGGQFKLFTKADNTDGLLDVLVYKEAGYKAVFDSFKGAALGDVDKWADSVEYVQARSLRVECDRPIPVEVDGELGGEFQEVVFQPAAKKLRVIAPEKRIGSRIENAVRTLMSIPKKIQKGD